MYGLSRREARFALVISSAHFAQHVYVRVLPPLIPILAVVFDYPLWQLGLLLTLFSIGFSLAQAPLGILADRIDRLYLLPLGIGVGAAGYLLFAVAPIIGPYLPSLTILGYTFYGGFHVMSLAMLIVGTGVAVVHPAGYPMISDNVDAGNKGRVLGLFGASSKLGDGVTPAIIAGLIIILAWEWIVLLFGLGGIVYAIVLFAVLSRGAYETAPARSRQTDEEQTNLREIDGPRFLYPFLAIYVFFLGTGFTGRGLGTFYPAFLVGVYTLSITIAGVEVGAESIASLFFAVLLFAGAGMQLYLGNLSDTYDPRTILLVCMGLATLGMLALALLPLHPVLLLLVTIVLGAGLFGVNPPRDAIMSDVSPPEFEGRMFGYMFTAVGLTGALFPTAIGYLMDVMGYREGFLLLAGGTMLSALAVGLLYSERVYVEDHSYSTSEPIE